MAINALGKGEANLGFACGINLITFAFDLNDFRHIISPEYRSRVFDTEANGYVRGEGYDSYDSVTSVYLLNLL